MNPQPVTLTGIHARLEPLGLHHAEALFAAGQSEEIWRYLPFDLSHSLEDMRAWIAQLERERLEGECLPFAIVDLSKETMVGATRFMDIRAVHRGLEIGGTWLARSYWKTALNTECKYLLLRHAFEDLGALRVQLKTDLRNTNSQRAIERLGAVREGVLRNHMIMPDGYVRSTVMYSITDAEWPAVKERLNRLMQPVSTNQNA